MKDIYKTTFEENTEALFILDRQMRILDINKAMEEIFSLKKEDLEASLFTDLIYIDNLDTRKKLEKAREKDQVVKFFSKLKTQGKNSKTLEWLIKNTGEILVGSCKEFVMRINPLELKNFHVLEEIEKEKEILLEAIEQSSVSIVMTDTNGDIVYVNSTFERLTGYSFEEVLGRNPRILKSGLTDDQVYEDLWATISKGQVWRGEQINKRKDGSFYFEESRITPIFNKNDELVYYFAIKHDITERKVLEDRLKEVAIKDALTGVYNRYYLMDRLNQLVEGYKRLGDTFTLAILDLDLFKIINDTYGHHAGDLVLKEFASIIQDNIRPYDILARYGGEEFILVFPKTNLDKAYMVLSRILNKIRKTDFSYEGRPISLTFSGGISEITELEGGKISVNQILRLSDKKLYKAKELGRNNIVK